MLKLVITVTCLSAVVAIAKAQSADLTGHEISALVAGATLEIDTPLGSKLPVNYAADGRLNGHARQLALYLGAAADTGRWWVASDQLCHKWDHWFNAEPRCLRLRRDGRKIQWWNENGQHGTAVLTAVPAAVAASTEGAGKLNSALATPIATPSQRSGTPLPVEAKADAGERTVQAQTVTPTANEQANNIRQAPPATKRAADPAYKVANVEHDDVLNVRSGPSTEFDVIGALPPGSRGVTMTGTCQSGWCPVQHQSTRGWVNRTYLAIDEPLLAISVTADNSAHDNLRAAAPLAVLRDPADAPRTCLTPPARALLERIEEKFGPVRLVSTCRRGAIIAGTSRPSRHASGNAVDFDAGARKAQIIEWLVANHHDGGTMTYADMDHIHVDIGPHFVSIAGGLHWASWRNTEPHFPVRVGRTNTSD
jgi:SH3 domain-containing protein